ncbi:Late blight resistance protein R1-A [Capsicum chinense]|nr:Late blight resistance protein R1-A [Capsicum chinense]
MKEITLIKDEAAEIHEMNMVGGAVNTVTAHKSSNLVRTIFSRRYLILVDDLWEDDVWDGLIGCFNDANNRSRIILTTQNLEVSNYTRFHSDPLQFRMFNDDESPELLRKKVFGEESFSPLLTNIGQQIAKKCVQLPLSVILVAGILAEMEKKEECWEQLANNFFPHIHKDARAIVEQRYQILSYNLKSCLLYFGAFLFQS